MRHNITKDDIAHALEYLLGSYVLNDGTEFMRTLVIGPDTSGRILELVVTLVDEDELLVIHAMKARKKNIAYVKWEDGEKNE